MSEKGAIEPGWRFCTAHVLLFQSTPPQITSKNLYSENGADLIRTDRTPSQKTKKPSRPQGTEKLGDTTLINATAFTHPTVNAGATPVIGRNSEAGSIQGNVGISQPDRIPRRIPSLKRTYIYYSSSSSFHYTNDCRQILWFCQCEKSIKYTIS